MALMLLMLNEQGSKHPGPSLYNLLSPRNLHLPSSPSPQPALVLQPYSQGLAVTAGMVLQHPSGAAGASLSSPLHSPSSTGKDWQEPEHPPYKPRIKEKQPQSKMMVAEHCLIGNG